MDKRTAGMARYSDDSGEHKGLYVSSGWLKFGSVAGPVGVILVGSALWLGARPDRTEVQVQVDKSEQRVVQRIDAVERKFGEDMRKLNEDVRELRAGMRELLRRKEK